MKGAEVVLREVLTRLRYASEILPVDLQYVRSSCPQRLEKVFAIGGLIEPEPQYLAAPTLATFRGTFPFTYPPAHRR
jgi:hypothetical protein